MKLELKEKPDMENKTIPGSATNEVEDALTVGSQDKAPSVDGKDPKDVKTDVGKKDQAISYTRYEVQEGRPVLVEGDGFSLDVLRDSVIEACDTCKFEKQADLREFVTHVCQMFPINSRDIYDVVNLKDAVEATAKVLKDPDTPVFQERATGADVVNVDSPKDSQTIEGVSESDLDETEDGASVDEGWL